MNGIVRWLWLAVVGVLLVARSAQAQEGPYLAVMLDVPIPAGSEPDYRDRKPDGTPYLVFRAEDASKLGEVKLDGSTVSLGACDKAILDAEPTTKDKIRGCLKLDHTRLDRGFQVTYVWEETPTVVAVKMPAQRPQPRPPAGPANPPPPNNEANAAGQDEAACSTAAESCTGYLHYYAYCRGFLEFQRRLKREATPPVCGAPENQQEGELALLLFGSDGKALAPLLQVDEDDTLLIVVSDEEPDQTIAGVTLTECAAPQVVRVYDGLTRVDLREAARPVEKPEYRILTAKNCSSDKGLKATVLVKKDDQISTATISVPTLALYRITIGLGLIYDFTQVDNWKAGAVKGESVPVLLKDTSAEGLGAVGFVALRLAPVDMKRVRSVWQALAPTVGVSLTAPLDHVYAGLLVEPWPGLGLLGGWHFYRAEMPAGGFVENDRIPGGVFKTDKRWADPKFKDFFAGVYLDSAVLGSILKAFDQ